MELDSRAVRWARKPEVEILTILASLQEKDHVARVEIGERVQQQVITRGLLLGIKLGLLVSVGEEGAEIGHQVSVTGRLQIIAGQQRQSVTVCKKILTDARHLARSE